MTESTKQIVSSFRPPIVAVLGHVDHGKTTLLDTIRKSHVATNEHGGITQHIGAYQISRQTKEGERCISFLDTPGHEAFKKMRSRGVSAADIAILVVASDDSVKPQTLESIAQIHAAGTPIIVAMNKVDLSSANPDKVKQDLAKAGVQVEGFGGDVPMVLVSGKTGTGIEELLDMILLVWDMHGIQSTPNATLEAVVIETKVDKGKGMVATVVVKNGTLLSGSDLFDGSKKIAKIRALSDESGSRKTRVGPGTPVEIAGFTSLPDVGAVLSDTAREVMKTAQDATAQTSTTPLSTLPDFLKPIDADAKESLVIVLKADTSGSLEAILSSLNPKIVVVSRGLGDVTEADILFAKSVKAFVIGFHVSVRPSVAKLAETEKVIHRTYAIIYELLDELDDVVAGMKEVLHKERELGVCMVLAEFPFNGERVAGVKVASGRIARGDTIKIIRKDVEIGRGKARSVKRGKEDVTKIEVGGECGVLFDKPLAFEVGDVIIAYAAI